MDPYGTRSMHTAQSEMLEARAAARRSAAHGVEEQLRVRELEETNAVLLAKVCLCVRVYGCMFVCVCARV